MACQCRARSRREGSGRLSRGRDGTDDLCRGTPSRVSSDLGEARWIRDRIDFGTGLTFRPLRTAR